MSAGDRARVTVFVKAAPERAFQVFTREIDLWWRRGPKFRHSGKHAGVLTFEEGVDGRIFETFAGRVQEVGRVRVWEPPARLVFGWRNANFAPHEATEVEVVFNDAPGGTNVVVEHRGWSTLPAGHPARHGLEGSAFTGMIGMWWGDLLTSFRESFASEG